MAWNKWGLFHPIYNCWRGPPCTFRQEADTSQIYHRLNFKSFSEIWNNLPTPPPPQDAQSKKQKTATELTAPKKNNNNILHRKKIDPGKGDDPNLESQPLVFARMYSPPKMHPLQTPKESHHLRYIFHRISSEAAMSCGNFPMKGQRHVICHWLWTSLCWSSK